MIKFGRLIIEGYCSIMHHEMDLDTGHTTIIRAPNGFGKTTLLSTISWVLYGKPSKEDVSDVNTWSWLRPKDYKGTKLEIYWMKDTEVHQVIRCSNYTGKVQGTKGGNRLVYLIEGIEVKNKKKLEIQALIEANLGLSYSLFKNSIMFGQGMKRLIQETGTEKKKLFEEVFDVAYISKSRVIAQKEREGLLKELNDIKNRSNICEANYKSSRNTFEELRAQESVFHSSLKGELKKYQMKVELNLKAINEKAKSNIENKKLLAKAKIDFGQLEIETERLYKAYNENKEKLDEVTSVRGLEKLTLTIIKLIPTNPKKAVSKLRELQQAINGLNAHNESRNSLANRTSTLQSEISKLKNIISSFDDLKEKLADNKSVLSNLKKQKQTISSPPYRVKARAYKKEWEALTKEIEPLQKRLEDYNWVIDDPLGNNGIKSYIFESSLDALNDIFKTYSEILGLRVEFGIDLSNARKDFYTLIEMNGRVVDYSELSGGQKQLINLSMAFAMWESASSAKELSILFLDEIFESLSIDNIEIVVELIKFISKGKSIYLITHLESLPLSNSKTINVNYKNGLTYFN